MLSATAGQRTPLVPPGTFRQLRMWTGRQWVVAAAVALAALVVIGEVGQTLPNTAHGRTYPVEWWNYLTLILSSGLLGLTAATFVVRSGHRVAAGVGSGAAGSIAAIAMACPVCSPLAIPLLGAGGALSFLTPHRGLISLLSVVMLLVTLLLRLRASTRCGVAAAPRQSAAAAPVPPRT